MKKRLLAFVSSLFIAGSSFLSFASPATSSEATVSEAVSYDATVLGDVPSWSDAVESVIASRSAVASSSEAVPMLYSSSGDVMSRSSVGTVTNTVDRTGVSIYYRYKDDSGVEYDGRSYINPDGSFQFYFDGTLTLFNFDFASTALPSAGNYTFSCDLSSDFSLTYTAFRLQSYLTLDNVATDSKAQYINDYATQNSGDFYIAPINVSLGNYASNINGFGLSTFTKGVSDVMSGSVRFNFTRYSGSDLAFTGVDSSSTDVQVSYEQGITSSLGSIGDTLEEIVATISLQIEALWNQMYNYIHIPQFNKLEEIRQAIENLDLNIDVDNSAIINKTQEQINNDNSIAQQQIQNDNANTEQVTNGYDNSGMTNTNDNLSGSLTEYEQIEDEVVGQVSDKINEFEFEDDLSNYTEPLSDVSYFLTGVYNGLGALNIPIGFSLTLSIALICIGFYRFKGGS